MIIDSITQKNQTRRSTKAKMEVATKEEMNPIAQDTKKGKLRCVHTYMHTHTVCTHTQSHQSTLGSGTLTISL